MHNEAHGPAGARTSPRKAVASGWIGSALEYYDFFIYAQAAALIFPQVFFPKGNPTVALIASLATYAVGYIARPVGAFVLGHWGDRHGRKNVLVLAMLLMGASTFAVALLPTYAQVGLLAPLLLVLLRLVQGFALEAVATFFLMLAVFGTVVDPKAPRIGGLGIGCWHCLGCAQGKPLGLVPPFIPVPLQIA